MEKIDSKIILNEAGIAGLAFGVVSGGFVFIPDVKLSWLLWIVKLAGLIWLMRWWMARLCNSYKGVTWRHTLKFGTWTAFFSALITGLCFYIAAAYVNPDQIQEAFDAVIRSGATAHMDSNQTAALEEMMDKLPIYGLVSNIIYCFLYGRILSRILCARIPGKNPFAESGKEQEDDLDDII